jgi:hypothetical protein
MSSVTFRPGLKPVPMSLIVSPRTTDGGVTRRRAVVEAPPARPASKSAVAAATNVAAVRTPVF